MICIAFIFCATFYSFPQYQIRIESKKKMNRSYLEGLQGTMADFVRWYKATWSLSMSFLVSSSHAFHTAILSQNSK